jgi:hypothetical protein
VTDVKYRLSNENDIPSLIRLWEQADWGTFTLDQWRERFIDTPFGPALVPVAEDQASDLVGQAVFTPLRLCVGGRTVRALRLSAPIIQRNVKLTASPEAIHPVMDLCSAGFAAALEQGYEVIFAYTQPRWLSMLRSGTRFGPRKWIVREYPCLAWPLEQVPAGPRGPGADLVVDRVVEFRAEHAALWDTLAGSLSPSCSVMRTLDWLRFKSAGRLCLEVRERSGGDLVGFAAFKTYDGLLLELVARRPSELETVIAATRDWLAAHPAERGRIRVVKAMDHPCLDGALHRLGFEAHNYRFSFICLSISSSVSPEEIDPDRWYLTPGD